MPATWRLDLWVIVVLAVAGGQVFKLVVYSATQRRLELGLLGQSAGLPSVHAAVGGCLVTACALRTGWRSPETSVALVFAVITVLDAVRVRSAAQQQRRVVHDLVLLAPDSGPWRRRVAGYLDIVAHTPTHVAAGLIWGFLFALALGAV
ncbi:MAG TPA: divergent PAP2 family protein [Candidatus Krumholzibacteria bacterium]|nr:divergent PAP2 family protein [Candidatus Krumholzibacteria bacterium]HPD71521.1 divergent PAP2 family protein [Candidatus Krumholzibacteria bacterium]HRY41546.1 divergent PAP2 family protein [Candidatus Krumholzibacteria bacterium]